MNERILRVFRETCDSQMEALLTSVVVYMERIAARELKVQQKVEARKAVYTSIVGRREKSKRSAIGLG